MPWGMGMSTVRTWLSLLVASFLAASLAVAAPAPASADPLAWSRQFGRRSVNQGFGVAADSTGVYVAGEFSSNDGSDAYIKKYDMDGAQLWARYRFGRPGREQGATVAASGSGVYTIADLTGGSRPFSRC
jgi:hypothetical protein